MNFQTMLIIRFVPHSKLRNKNKTGKVNMYFSKQTFRDPVYQYNIDSIFPNKTDYLYNRPPEDFCLGKYLNSLNFIKVNIIRH